MRGYRLTACIERPSSDLMRAYEQGDFPVSNLMADDNRLLIGLPRPGQPDEYWLDPIQEVPGGLGSQGARDLDMEMYPIPPVIQRQKKVMYDLEALEMGTWIEDTQELVAANVVAGYSGHAHSPYFISSRSDCPEDWHAAAWFSHRSLGRVSLLADQGGYRLVIDHANIQPMPPVGSEVGVHSSVLLSNLKVRALDHLPGVYSKESPLRTKRWIAGWLPALEGLNDRIHCGDCNDSHYSLPVDHDQF